jgi:hypothetical protein
VKRCSSWAGLVVVVVAGVVVGVRWWGRRWDRAFAELDRLSSGASSYFVR